MIINPKFKYPKIPRITDETTGIRHYTCPETGLALPSVTTILAQTSDKTKLNEWIERVGQKKANKVKDEASVLGTFVHTHVENYIQGLERPKGNNLLRMLSYRMADKIINQGLPKVSEVWGLEVGMYLPGTFAGTTDLAGLHDNSEAIMDHKTSKKMKLRENIPDYMCQLAAYGLCHNEIYGTNIRKGVIFMVDRELNYEEFVIEGNEFTKQTDIFMRRLEDYYEQQAKQIIP